MRNFLIFAVGFFLACLLVSSIAEAQRPVLNVYYVRSERAISLDTLSQLNKVNKATMRHDFKRKIKIRVRGIEERESFPYNSSLKEFYHYYHRVNTYRRKWALVIAPSQRDAQGRTWITGRAQTWCWKQQEQLTLAVVNAMEANSTGAPRVLHSIFGALHELGHTLSLKHSEDAGSIMHYGVLAYVLNGVSFSEAEKFRAKHCLRAK